MSRVKELTLAAEEHDQDRADCSVCGHLPPSVPPCYEWERVPAAGRSAEAPEPIPAPNDPPVIPPWHGC